MHTRGILCPALYLFNLCALCGESPFLSFLVIFWRPWAEISVYKPSGSKGEFGIHMEPWSGRGRIR